METGVFLSTLPSYSHLELCIEAAMSMCWLLPKPLNIFSFSSFFCLYFDCLCF